jgi:hypothetical protein
VLSLIALDPEPSQAKSSHFKSPHMRGAADNGAAIRQPWGALGMHDRAYTTKDRHPRRQRRRDVSTTAATASATFNDLSAEQEQGSVLWTILLIGLILCLADVAYILSYVDAQEGGAAGIIPPPFHVDAILERLPSPGRASLKRGKERVLKIIQDAGIGYVDDETLEELPLWQQVVDLYGPDPVVYGLDQCRVFQQHSPTFEHFVSTAGTFNSGTNLMAELLIANCHMEDRMKKLGDKQRGVRWQVPWGKHTPPGDDAFRNSHKTNKDRNVSVDDILPAVTIRDPYSWMESMCRINYGAHWYSDMRRHCPNLLPDEQDLLRFSPYLKENKAVDVHVKYSDFWKHHTSLAHFWNDWYREYMNVKFSRIIVRYEDLLFHTRNVTEQVCRCAGGTIFTGDDFKFIVDTAKKGASAHGNRRTGFVDALIKYGKPDKRGAKFADRDLEYARANLDPEMMTIFGYRHPPSRDVL